MENTILTKVASAFKDNYQKYSIPIIDNPLDDNFLDKWLDHAKKDILKTLINIFNKFIYLKKGSGLYDYLLCCMQIYNNNLIFCNCMSHIVKSYHP